MAVSRVLAGRAVNARVISPKRSRALKPDRGMGSPASSSEASSPPASITTVGAADCVA